MSPNRTGHIERLLDRHGRRHVGIVAGAVADGEVRVVGRGRISAA